MTDRPAPCWTEDERLASLGRYDILDTPPEQDFDDLAGLAADLLDAPMAAVTLVDHDRQWFKSEVGLGVRQTPLDSSVCMHALLEPAGLVVTDLTHEARFAGNPLVTGERHLRFYAGEQLVSREGLPLGMLCVLDTVPRPAGLTARQAMARRTLARQVTAQRELRRALAEQRRAGALHRQIIDSTTDHAIVALDPDGLVTCFNAGAERITGWSELEMLGQTTDRLFVPEDLADGVPEREIRRAREDGRSADKRFHRRKSGERFWADGEMRPLLDEAGRPSGMVKVFSDRTAEREAEQRLMLLSDASSGLLAAAEPDDVLGPLLERGADLLGFDRACLHAVLADGALRPTRVIGPDADGWAQASIVAESRRRFIPSDGEQAYAGFPVVAGGRLHGVLSFGSALRRTFDADALSFFATLARFIAVVRERLDRETSLRELNATLARRVAEQTRERDQIWQVSRDMLGVADERGVWLSINPAWTHVLGWPAERILGRSSQWLEHPDDVEKTRAEIGRLAAGHATRACQNRLRAADGGYRILCWTAVPVDGRFYTVARDVTGERERERALRDQEEFTRLALSAVGGVGGWTYDVGSDRFTGDAAIAELYGLDVAETASGIGRARFLANVHPDDRPRIERVVGRGALRSGELELEYRVRHPDGRLRWILSRGHTQFDADGTPIRRNGVGVEITRQRNLEDQLRQASKMEAVGQLTGGLAHDFNNLLTGIVGSLELLGTRLAQGRMEGAQRYIDAAQDAAGRAAALTHRLLAFSRRQTLDPKPVAPNARVSGRAELIRRTVGPAITVESAGGDVGAILVDPSQLENALLNLCINARDAMPSGGRLTVETTERVLDEAAGRERELTPGRYVSLSVTDEGVGMPPDVVARAFDPFFTTKPIGQGTGLGLSMIYGFVRQSGGEVRIHSAVGHGTTVSLLLPRHGGAVELSAPSPSLSDAPRAEQDHSVLVVDDEQTVRMLVTEVLNDLGYNALEAPDGASALDTLRTGARVDLLVTDVGLPGGMSGRQLAEAGRALRPELSVLFITGYAENAVLGPGPADPGTQVMTKPFSMEALASRIKTLLAGVSWGQGLCPWTKLGPRAPDPMSWGLGVSPQRVQGRALALDWTSLCGWPGSHSATCRANIPTSWTRC